MLGGRRHQRYPINLRLRLQLPTGELETLTHDVSLAGFSAPGANLPESGTPFGFAIHLPDGKVVGGTASAMRIGDDAAGFSCDFDPAHRATWEAFVSQEQDSGGVWRMLARYALSARADPNAAREVRENGPLGVWFRRRGAAGQDANEQCPVLRLHMVGENGEAFRLAFEKHPSQPPESSVFSGAAPSVVELVRQTVSRILAEDVLLKRHPQAPVEPVRLVEMKRGGFGHLVQRQGSRPGLLGLHGGELIVIEIDGERVFPFFDDAELERIACDSFRRGVDVPRPVLEPAHPAPVVGEERFAAEYQHQHVDTRALKGCSDEELRDAMAASDRVQTRSYGERTLKLFPELWLEVRRAATPKEPVRGFAVEDGPSLCVFVLVGKGAPRVVRLEPNDVVSIIRGPRADREAQP